MKNKKKNKIKRVNKRKVIKDKLILYDFLSKYFVCKRILKQTKRSLKSS